MLRLQPGAPITVADGNGRLAHCVLDSFASSNVAARVLETEERAPALPPVTVFQGALKGRKVDEVVLRLAELGVRDLWVFHSTRAVKQLDDARAERALDRWNALARAAGKQSRRAHWLRVRGILRWPQVVERLAGDERGILLWEDATDRLRAALSEDAPGYALVVGPEGGFSAAEANEAAAAGATIAGLGPGILRAEHAAAIASALVFYEHGVIG